MSLPAASRRRILRRFPHLLLRLWPALFLCIVGLDSTAVLAEARGGIAVVGRERAEIVLPEGVVVADYANNGFRLRVDGQRARVEVEVRALSSQAVFALPPDRSQEGDEVRRLARAITAPARDHYQAVSRVLGWVSRNVHYRLDRGEPQDPRAVLERRTAYCTGTARLTVALLEAVAIEAREVAGLVVQEGGEARLHRWVEIHYPDRGWAFSDPLRSHHYVPATYLPLASERLRVPEPQGLTVEFLSHQEDFWIVDRFPGVTTGVRGRKNDDRQHVGVLRVETPVRRPASAVLERDGVRRRVPLEDGAGTFLGVEPGRYTLRLEGEGIESRTLQVRLWDRSRRIVQLSPSEERGR